MMQHTDSQDIEVATFYRFVALADYAALAAKLHNSASANRLLGTIIIAAEGINATLAGDSSALRRWLAELTRDERFADLAPRLMKAPRMPFYRLKVKLRDEIVTLGQPDVAPHERTGTHVGPEQWDELLEDPEVLVIDARNRYEVAVGTFAGATDPQTESFRQFPDYVNENLDPAVHRKVAMFCTGGIRCEKASAWMLARGFTDVYQLSGGVLAYLQQKTAEEGRWRGGCFLFDQRVAVGYGLERSDIEICHGCRYPLTPSERAAPEYEAGVSCPHCAAELSDKRRDALRERHRQEHLARRRGTKHLGNRQG